MIRWPWSSKHSDRLVFSWHAGSLAYIRSKRFDNGAWKIVQAGVEHPGADQIPALVQRLSELNLRGLPAKGMLRSDQYQLLQVEAPQVPDVEMRAALPYQIRSLVEHPIDDLVVDMLHIGDAKSTGPRSVYAVVATRAVVNSLLELAAAMDWSLDVIDIQDAAQRNLQSHSDKRNGLAGLATGALMLLDRDQALFTICVKGELYQSRRLTIAGGVGGKNWLQTGTAKQILEQVQRSIDAWGRTYGHLPLVKLRVQFDTDSAALADLLARETGLATSVLDYGSPFRKLHMAPMDRLLCIPLVGIQMRSHAHQQ